MRKMIATGLVLLAVGAAFAVGRITQPSQGIPMPVVNSRAQMEDDLVVPSSLTIPANLPVIKVDNPTAVLTGEMKIPPGLLRTEPPAAQPDIIIPTLPNAQK